MLVSPESELTPSEVQTAKAVCSRCSVVDDCLVYAIVNPVRFGVWGGLSADELEPVRSAWHSQRTAFVA